MRKADPMSKKLIREIGEGNVSLTLRSALPLPCCTSKLSSMPSGPADDLVFLITLRAFEAALLELEDFLLVTLREEEDFAVFFFEVLEATDELELSLASS